MAFEQSDEPKIGIADLIDRKSAGLLNAWIYTSDRGQSIHFTVVDWLTSTSRGKELAKQWDVMGIDLEYGAFLLEFFMKLNRQ